MEEKQYIGKEGSVWTVVGVDEDVDPPQLAVWHVKAPTYLEVFDVVKASMREYDELLDSEQIDKYEAMEKRTDLIPSSIYDGDLVIFSGEHYDGK